MRQLKHPAFCLAAFFLSAIPSFLLPFSGPPAVSAGLYPGKPANESLSATLSFWSLASACFNLTSVSGDGLPVLSFSTTRALSGSSSLRAARVVSAPVVSRPWVASVFSKSSLSMDVLRAPLPFLELQQHLPLRYNQQEAISARAMAPPPAKMADSA